MVLFGTMTPLTLVTLLITLFQGEAKYHVLKEGSDMTLVEENKYDRVLPRSVESRDSTCKCRCKKLYSNQGWTCCTCTWTDEACFPADAHVQLESGDRVNMSRLQVGHRVLTGTNEGIPIYSKVVTFLKRHHTTDAVYLQLKTIGGSIKMTSRHVVFTSAENNTSTMTSKFAHDVVVGDYLFITDGSSLGPSRVTAIDSDIMEGVYVPLTETGTIVVDGILASCYSSVSHGLAHFGLAPLRWFPTLFDIPLDEHGMHPYVGFMKWISHLILPSRFQGNFKNPTFPVISMAVSNSERCDL